MKMSKTYKIILGVLVLAVLISCERDFDIPLKNNQPQLIVEAYINNELPLFNYVALGNSQDYYAPGFENVAVTGAMVTITEGTLLANNTYAWNTASKKTLKEVRLPQYSNALLPGIYFDSTLATDETKALKGIPGKHYLLEIETGGKRYTAITALLPIIPIDSLTSGNHYMDTEDDTAVLKARITIHYKDPDTIGNTQLYYYRHTGNSRNFGWGGIGTNSFTPNTDDLVNGQYLHITQGKGFEMKDSVSYYLASVERNVYNFWDSYNKARSNDGPFSTPVKLQNTINGENVIGCFSGFSISSKTIMVK